MKNPVLIGHLVLTLFLGIMLHRNIYKKPSNIKETSKKDTIYVKEKELYIQLIDLWKNHPIDSIKTPKIVLIK